MDIYDISFDYNSIDKSNILNIHQYLIAKNSTKWCLRLLEKCLLSYWVPANL